MKTRLKVLRAEKNLTQAQLAKALGTNQPAVSAWERGDNIPRAPMMQKIADYFGVDSQYLLFGDEKSPLVHTDERALDDELVSKLTSLTPEEMQKVDAFVQGLLANR